MGDIGWNSCFFNRVLVGWFFVVCVIVYLCVIIVDD